MGKTEKKQTQNSKRKIDINLELQEIQNSEYFFFIFLILTSFPLSELGESPNCGTKSLTYPMWQT